MQIRNYKDSDFPQLKKLLEDTNLYYKPLDKKEIFKKKIDYDQESIIIAEDNNKIQNEVEAMDASGAAFRTYDYLKNLISLSRNNESFLWIEKFSKMLTEIYPQDDQVWIDIALAQAYQGKNDEAIETAKKVIEYGGEGKKDQVDQFIKEVRAGKYKPTIKKK